MYIILNLLCTSNFHPLCFFCFFNPASCACRGRPLLKPRLLYEDLWRTRMRWPCRPPHCRLQGTSHNSDNKNRRDVYCDRLQKLEQVSSLCMLALCAHIHTFTHRHTHTHTDPSPSHWSKLFNQISVVPTCLDLNQQTQAVDWVNSETRFPPLPPSLPASLSPSLSIGLQCVGVQQCVIGFSVQLCSLKPPPGSVGESQLQQGWAWPAGGRMGGR